MALLGGIEPEKVDPYHNYNKGSTESVGRESTFAVDKPVKKESTFTADSTEKTRRKSKALNERKVSQANNIKDNQSNMAKGKNKDKGKDAASSEVKPDQNGKEKPGADDTSKDNDKGKQSNEKTNNENEKPDTSAAGDSEKQTDSKAKDNNPAENKDKKDDQDTKPDSNGDKGSAMGNTAATVEDKKDMSASQGSLGGKNRNTSFVNARHVSSLSLKKDSTSRRGSTASGKEDKAPDKSESGDGQPVDNDTKEPDTVRESPKGGSDKDNSGENSETAEKSDDKDPAKENNNANSIEYTGKDETPVEEGQEEVGDKAKDTSSDPPDSEGKQDGPKGTDKENSSDEKPAEGEAKEKEKEKSPSPVPLAGDDLKPDEVPKPDDNGEAKTTSADPEPSKEGSKEETQGEESKEDAEEKPQDSHVEENSKGEEKKEESTKPEKPSEVAADVTNGGEYEANDTEEDAKSPREEDPKVQEVGEEPVKGENDGAEETGVNENDRNDKVVSDAKDDRDGANDQVDNVQSRENTEIEDADESDANGKQADETENEIREATPRIRPTPTPRTPKRNEPNHPSSRPAQREQSDPKSKARSPRKSEQDRPQKEEARKQEPPKRDPPKRSRDRDYPGKPIRVENRQRKKPNDDTPRGGRGKAQQQDTKYNPRNRKKADDSDTDVIDSVRESNRNEPKKQMGRSSRMGPSKSRVQNVSDDPSSDYDRTPRSRVNRNHDRYSSSPRYQEPKPSPRYKPSSPEYDDQSEVSDPFLTFDRNSKNLAHLEKDTMTVLDVIRNMQDENRRAMGENSKLREKNLKLRQDVSALREEMAEVVEDRDNMAKRLEDEADLDRYVRKLEKDAIRAEHDKQKYLAKIHVQEEESKKQQRKLEDKETEITVAIGELQKLQKDNQRLLAEVVNGGPKHRPRHVLVTEVNDVGTQTYPSVDTMDETVGLVDILKQEVSSLKDYNSHLQKSLREEMARRELVQSLLDDVMSTNEGFRKHVSKLKDLDTTEVDTLTSKLRDMEVTERQLIAENTQLKAQLTLYEAQKQKEDAIEEILTGRSSKRDKNLERRFEEMERKLRASEQRVIDLEGYLDEIYNNEDVKIVIRSDPRSNVTETSLPALPSVYPDRNQPTVFTKVDLNAYNSYARLAKNKAKFFKRF